MAPTGSQWRHLPDEWNNVFRRYRQWVETGVFDAMLETLAEMAGRERSADMIDSTIVRAHHCALGIKRGLRRPRHLAGPGVASSPSSTPAATERAGLSALFWHQARRMTCTASHLFRMLTDKVKALLADRGYDADAIREEIAFHGIQALIPASAGAAIPPPTTATNTACEAGSSSSSTSLRTGDGSPHATTRPARPILASPQHFCGCPSSTKPSQFPLESAGSADQSPPTSRPVRRGVWREDQA